MKKILELIILTVFVAITCFTGQCILTALGLYESKSALIVLGMAIWAISDPLTEMVCGRKK